MRDFEPRLKSGREQAIAGALLGRASSGAPAEREWTANLGNDGGPQNFNHTN